MKHENTNFLEQSKENPTSLTLLNLVKSRDEDAWELLNNLYSPLIRYWCRKYSVSSCDIDDVAQDVFRSVYRGVDNFDKTADRGSFRAWLWTITRNQIRDYFRNRNSKPVASGGTDAQIRMQHVPDLEPAEVEAEFEEKGGLTQAALEIVRGEIKERTFQAFWRSTIEGVAADVVSNELEMSIDSVYQAKSRVLKRMRDLLS